ncbi:MAG: lysophospholipid acyltransferase family protein [Thermodesulfobacteriota bacterium]
MSKILGLNKVTQTYKQIDKNGGSRRFLQEVLAALKVTYHCQEKEILSIPASGPVMVVANHPFGAIEGIILADILSRQRQEIKILANYLLAAIQELRDLFIFIDPFQQTDAVRKNIRPLREALNWLQQGGLLAAFPAGEVAHFTWRQRKIADPPWQESVAWLIRKSRAAVVPVYIHGANGLLFQILGLLHPWLRTAMLPRELFNKKGKTIELRIGNAIPFRKLEALAGNAEMLDYLRLRTQILKTPYHKGKGRNHQPVVRSVFPFRPHPRPVAPSKGRDQLRHEVAGLPREQLLAQNGEYAVYCARARQIPNLLHEIGRLREVTFRLAHEGTGKALDLDQFDQTYLQLFLWNEKEQELVGAYRLGPTDSLAGRYGENGLYTRTLFYYDRRLLRQIHPALELGRSFVRPEYQKNYSSLLLLWKGIGAFVVQNPRYSLLFGAVSINNEYHLVSQQLMAMSLKINNYIPELSRLVKARRPSFKFTAKFDLIETPSIIQNMNEVSELVAEIEPDNKGIPILLKHYLKMGGKILGFNRDPHFNNALDVFIVVDLLNAPRKLLELYMGKEGVGNFYAYHQSPCPLKGKRKIFGNAFPQLTWNS